MPEDWMVYCFAEIIFGSSNVLRVLHLATLRLHLLYGQRRVGSCVKTSSLTHSEHFGILEGEQSSATQILFPDFRFCRYRHSRKAPHS